MLDETIVSETIENKATESMAGSQRPPMRRARRPGHSKVTVADFDLYRIPSNIDIDFVIKEIILPRVPDGYAFRPNEMLQCRPQRGKPDAKPTKVDGAAGEQCDSLLDYLVESDSPRPLFPVPSRSIHVELVERSPRDGEYLLSRLLGELSGLQGEKVPQFFRPVECASEPASEPNSAGAESEESETGGVVDETTVASAKEDVAPNQPKRAGEAVLPVVTVAEASDKCSDGDSSSDEEPSEPR